MSKPCRWFPLFLSVPGVFAALGGTHALAQTPAQAPQDAASQLRVAPPAGEAASDSNELYLEVTLNSVPSVQLSRFVLRQGALYASPETLKAIGLKLPAAAASDRLFPLASLDGLKVSFNASAQNLILVAPIELLGRPVERLGAPLGERVAVDPSTRVPGLIVNYDLFAQQSQGGLRSFSAFTETRLFGMGSGVFSNTMNSRAEDAMGGVTRHGNVRLDTSWQRNFPDEAVTLTVGDAVTGSLSWSRATRIGGLRLSRNFALQPYRVTTPLASFQGSAVLPSTVDLFVNGLKQSTQSVQPGQFQISGIPTVGGAGQAQMVITDINGQSRVVNFDLYGAPQLLDEGLSDWSLDLGTIRRNYGITSFSYGGSIASATGRYGWSSRTTLEAHVESGAGVQQAGVGGVWRLGEQAGLLSASLAGSRQTGAVAALAGDDGAQGALGYQWNSQRYALSINTLRRSAGFRDVASLPAELPSRGNDSAYFGISSRSWGQYGISLIRQSYFNAPQVRYASLGWSYALPGKGQLSLNVNRNLDDSRGSTIYLSWSMPLERNLTVSASAQRNSDASSLSLDAARTPSNDTGGWGWRVQAGLGDSRNAQAQISQLGRYGQWTAGISQLGGQGMSVGSKTIYASANGGLVLIDGQAYASRRVDDAFAVVSTSGVPNVPVLLENRMVGETNASGMLFVTQLNAYQRNRLAIDTLKLPPDMRITRSTMDAVPESRSGMLASFGMRRIVSAQFSVRDTAGEWLPAGSQAWLDGAASGAPAVTVIGFDGLAYLEDPPPDAVLRVQPAPSAAGSSAECRVTLPAVLPPYGLADLGVLTCQ